MIEGMRESDPFLERNLAGRLHEALETMRVVYLGGARQAGKTTLAQSVAEELGADFLTLDSLSDRSFAIDDPEGFIDRATPLVIDEVQRGGNDLLLAIKARVDRDRRPGQFLLTGSTRFLTVPTLSESLAGRIDLVDLWPLSQGEIAGKREDFVDRLFASPAALRRRNPSGITRDEAFQRVCRGGFPEAVSRRDRHRQRWFASYIRTLTERDVGEITNIRRLDDLSALVRLLAARTSTQINLTALSAEIQAPRTTMAGYLPLLEQVFLLFPLPAWSKNLTSKQVKQPKIHFTDTGLAAHILGTSPEALARPQAQLAGELLESFVASELLKQFGWAETDVTAHHFRDAGGTEVDLVLEARDGRIAAIEVKAGRSVGRNDLRGLTLLRDRIGEDFVHGVVLCCSDEVRHLGDRLTAMPLTALWEEG